MIEDAEGSCNPIRDVSPHFPIFREFEGASYATRYNILCRKLMQEQLYTAAAVLMSPRSASTTGKYVELTELTGLRTFVSKFAGQIAAEGARYRTLLQEYPP